MLTQKSVSFGLDETNEAGAAGYGTSTMGSTAGSGHQTGQQQRRGIMRRGEGTVSGSYRNGSRGGHSGDDEDDPGDNDPDHAAMMFEGATDLGAMESV